MLFLITLGSYWECSCELRLSSLLFKKVRWLFQCGTSSLSTYSSGKQTHGTKCYRSINYIYYNISIIKKSNMPFSLSNTYFSTLLLLKREQNTLKMKTAQKSFAWRSSMAASNVFHNEWQHLLLIMHLMISWY